MNRRLALGLALLGILVALALASASLAPHERGYTKSIIAEEEGGKTVYYVAPEAPGRHFVLGSDTWAYDLFSEMLHGLGWTLAIVFLTAGARSVLGLVLGLALGSSGRAGRPRRGFSPLAALPSFILAAFVLYPLTINSALPAPALLLVQSAVLVLVDVPPLVASFRARTASLMRSAFVEAASLAGASRTWTLGHHILPFALPELLEALPLQALGVASMVGKLGVVNLFIGGTTLTVDPVIFLSAKGEWLGLLGYYYPSASAHPWLFLAPFGGWLLVLACVGLLASGSRRAFEANRGLRPD